MTATSRKVSRKALGALLKTALEGVGKLAQAVYDHAPADFTQSPVVFVSSKGTNSKRQGMGQTQGYNKFRLEVYTYVAAANNDPGWTPDVAADALDDIEAVIREVILTNPNNAAWKNIRLFDEFTEVIHLSAEQASGIPYDVEVITVEVEVYDA